MDNYYQNCPPKMSDGRQFTDYRSSSRREEFEKNIVGFTRNDDYRMFLQKNGNQIMNEEWAYLKQTKMCPVKECVHIYPTRPNPSTFLEERINYDELSKHPNSRTALFPCKKYNDYRINSK
jgi:hypothetical protein